jgi:hypothetical protein
VWDGYANSVFPNKPLITDIAFYGPAGGANCYLTLAQTLSEAWAAVINNTDGLAWWAVGQGETSGGPMCDGTTATYTELWNGLIQATGTVKDVVPTILSPVSIWYSHTQPESTVQTIGRAGWIFAANLTQNEISDSFSGLPAGSTVIAYAGNSDGSNRTVCTNCGSSFTDSFPGFTAYAYEITGGTPTLTPTATSTPKSTPAPTTTPVATPTPAATPTLGPATITSPAPGSIVSGIVSFTCANPAGSANLYIDDVFVGRRSYSWNTTTFANGSHYLLCNGYRNGSFVGGAVENVTVSN